MAASEYTQNLGLCKWASTDKPKRADFVSDNSIIDTALGGHTANTTMHLTSDEKTRLNAPYTAVTYAGTGVDGRSISVSNSPKLAIVFQKDTPMLTISGNTVKANFAICYYGLGSSGGATLSQSALTLRQTSSYNLNEEDGQYVAILFR